MKSYDSHAMHKTTNRVYNNPDGDFYDLFRTKRDIKSRRHTNHDLVKRSYLNTPFLHCCVQFLKSMNTSCINTHNGCKQIPQAIKHTTLLNSRGVLSSKLPSKRNKLT
ncbi:hypothetical protein Mapa_012405 [Marchantia paleacea]|nr:hypothetical protein Mapa_012405 [Marchantia paleacea]